MTKKKTEEEPPDLSKYTYEDDVVPVDELGAWPGNARKQDVDKIAKAIRRFGFYGKCIVHRASRKIIIGKHRWLAAQKVGLERIPIQWVDMPEDEAKRLNLWDNKVTDDAGYDEDARIKQLTELARTEEGLEATGYDADELADLIMKNAEQDDLPPEEDDVLLGSGSADKEVVCPNCDWHFSLKDAEFVE